MIINNSTLTKKAFNLKNVQYLYNNYIYDGDSYVNYGKKDVKNVTLLKVILKLC